MIDAVTAASAIVGAVTLFAGGMFTAEFRRRRHVPFSIGRIVPPAAVRQEPPRQLPRAA